LIDWSLTALSARYRASRSYSLVYVLGNGSTLGVLYISYSVVDDHQHK